MVNNMRVVGEPSFISDNMDMDQNEVHFGEVHLMDHTEIQVVIANFDSTQLDMNFWLTDEMGEMFHIPGNDTFNIQPFTSDVLRIAVTPGHQEGFVETNLMMESNYAGMEMLSMPVRAIIVPRYEPIILNVADVPNDQGGWVTLDFTRSYLDGDFGQNRTQLYTVELMSDNVWMAAVSSVAYQNSVYRALVHTLQDSGMIGDGITDFRIVAGMDEGVWVSNVFSGYSTDDIAPGSVTSLLAQTVGNDISLSWEYEGDDFYQFSVYRDISADFEPSTDNLFMNTSDFNVVDSTVEESVTYYYTVMVTDFGGNLSEPSNYAQGIVEVLAVDEGLLPIKFALHQNFPNPFNPTTKINYDLPESGHVNISIFNITGRKIRSLVSGAQEAGFRSITWDATNDIGQPVSAGMYIYTIESKDFRATRKMVLLK